MNHTEKLTRYTANFVDELVCSGLRHAVISPGSRSTPLAILCSEHEKLKEWILIDERSAAYFALGMAKETGEPVALICTSGTAAANYFPAIIEAYYARVPLIVLTADRPHELRGVGASQTINQLNMYGPFVKDFQEMALPDRSHDMLKYVRSRAARAFRESLQGNPGPVHFNFPFREPLLPDLSLPNLWGKREGIPYNLIYDGKKQLESEQVQVILQKITRNQRGLLVCGPQTDPNVSEQLSDLSKTLNIPILADPLSQLRAGPHEKENIISTYDAILKLEKLRKKLKPDYIIRFGAMPISKSFLFYVQEHEDALQIVVENHREIREPTNHHSEYVFADSATFCSQLHSLVNSETMKYDSSWLTEWKRMEKVIVNELQLLEDESLTEGKTIQEVLYSVPDDSSIFVANSMPVRDLDTFFSPMDKCIRVHANRGVSGIDGTMSSALGVAAASEKHVTLIIGDLSFYHDLNGLLAAKHYDINITIILINNNGGGIFSFLPQATEKKHFESLFGTPLNIEFQKAVEMYGGNYELVSEKKDFLTALRTAYGQHQFSVIEVQTDRTENVKWHRQLWNKIGQRLMEK